MNRIDGQSGRPLQPLRGGDAPAAEPMIERPVDAEPEHGHHHHHHHHHHAEVAAVLDAGARLSGAVHQGLLDAPTPWSDEVPAEAAVAPVAAPPPPITMDTVKAAAREYLAQHPELADLPSYEARDAVAQLRDGTIAILKAKGYQAGQIFGPDGKPYDQMIAFGNPGDAQAQAYRVTAGGARISEAINIGYCNDPIPWSDVHFTDAAEARKRVEAVMPPGGPITTETVRNAARQYLDKHPEIENEMSYENTAAVAQLRDGTIAILREMGYQAGQVFGPDGKPYDQVIAFGNPGDAQATPYRVTAGGGRIAEAIKVGYSDGPIPWSDVHFTDLAEARRQDEAAEAVWAAAPGAPAAGPITIDTVRNAARQYLDKHPEIENEMSYENTAAVAQLREGTLAILKSQGYQAGRVLGPDGKPYDQVIAFGNPGDAQATPYRVTAGGGRIAEAIKAGYSDEPIPWSDVH